MVAEETGRRARRSDRRIGGAPSRALQSAELSERIGVEPSRANGCHTLRHFYASTALHEGESTKALSEYLGHADPGFTLRTYTHLVENSLQQTKRAIDTVFGHASADDDAEEDDKEDQDGDRDDLADQDDDDDE